MFDKVSAIDRGWLYLCR